MDEKRSASEIKTSGEVVVEETTRRGLKARHAQMIALGGSIGMYSFPISLPDTKPFLRYWIICRKRWCPCSRRASLHSSWLFDSVHPSSLCCHRYHRSCDISACQRRDNELLWSPKCIQKSRVCYGMAILLLTQHIGAVRGKCSIVLLKSLKTTDRPSK